MWYRCEAFGQSNQGHQLQLLQKVTRMKNCDFCEDMSKSKYTRAPQTVHNTHNMNIVKGYFYIILF